MIIDLLRRSAAVSPAEITQLFPVNKERCALAEYQQLAQHQHELTTDLGRLVPNAEPEVRKALLKLRRKIAEPIARTTNPHSDTSHTRLQYVDDSLNLSIDKFFAARTSLRARLTELDCDPYTTIAHTLQHSHVAKQLLAAISDASLDVNEALTRFTHGELTNKRTRKLGQALANYAIRSTYGTVPFGAFTTVSSPDEGEPRSSVSLNLSMLAGVYGELCRARTGATMLGKAPTTQCGDRLLYWRTPKLLEPSGSVSLKTELATLPAHDSHVHAVETLFAASPVASTKQVQAVLPGAHAQRIIDRFMASGYLFIDKLLDISRAQRPEDALTEVLATCDQTNGVVRELTTITSAAVQAQSGTLSVSRVTEIYNSSCPTLSQRNKGVREPVYVDIARPYPAIIDHPAPTPETTERRTTTGENDASTFDAPLGYITEALDTIAQIALKHPAYQRELDAMTTFMEQRHGNKQTTVDLVTEFASDILPELDHQQAMDNSTHIDAERTADDTLNIRTEKISTAVITNHYLHPTNCEGGQYLWDRCYGGPHYLRSRFHRILSHPPSIPATPEGTIFAELAGGANFTNLQHRPPAGVKCIDAPGDWVYNAPRDAIRLSDMTIQPTPSGRLRLVTADGTVVVPIYTGYVGKRRLPALTRTLLLFGDAPEQNWQLFHRVALRRATQADLQVTVIPRVVIGSVIVAPKGWRVTIKTRNSGDDAPSYSAFVLHFMRVLDEHHIPRVCRYQLGGTAQGYQALADLDVVDSENALTLRALYRRLRGSDDTTFTLLEGLRSENLNAAGHLTELAVTVSHRQEHHRVLASS